MALHGRPARRTLRIAALIIAISAIAILPVRFAYIHYLLGEDVALIPGACITEPVATVNNIAGEDFVITYVNCDTLAKDEAINVYVLSKSTLGTLLHHKTLIFKYDPAMSIDAPALTSQRWLGKTEQSCKWRFSSSLA